MVRAQPRFEAAGAVLHVVTFSNRQHVGEVFGASPSHPILLDPQRSLYKRLGMGRTSIFSFFKPRVLAHFWSTLRPFARARGLRVVAKDDPWQLGGDAVIDRWGVLRWVYASRDAHDRPTVADLLRAALDCAQPGEATREGGSPR